LPLQRKNSLGRLFEGKGSHSGRNLLLRKEKRRRMLEHVLGGEKREETSLDERQLEKKGKKNLVLR